MLLLLYIIFFIYIKYKNVFQNEYFLNIIESVYATLTNSNRSGKDIDYLNIFYIFLLQTYLSSSNIKTLYIKFVIDEVREYAYHNMCENKNDKVLKVFLNISKIIHRLCVEKRKIFKLKV